MLVERCLPFYFSFLVRHVQSHDHARKQGTAWRPLTLSRSLYSDIFLLQSRFQPQHRLIRAGLKSVDPPMSSTPTCTTASPCRKGENWHHFSITAVPEAKKYTELLQSYLTQEYMPMVPSSIEGQIIVVVIGFFVRCECGLFVVRNARLHDCPIYILRELQK